MTMTLNRIGGVRGYSIYQIGLHWLIALLVFAQLIFGESMTEAIEAAEEGEPVSALEGNLADMHYYFGIAILALVAVRLVLRLKVSEMPSSSRAWAPSACFCVSWTATCRARPSSSPRPT